MKISWSVAVSRQYCKLLGKLEEFIVYLDNNRHFIVNYGDRYRHGEPIASGFVESAVNQVVSKRFVKRQQMAWRPRHAHNLLQIRTAVLNDQLRSYVERWYPSIAGEENHRKPCAHCRCLIGLSAVVRSFAPVLARSHAEGLSWDGQGELPDWLRRAVNAGQTVEFFRIG